METIVTQIVAAVNDVLWNKCLVLLFLLLGSGVYFSIRTRFVQIRKFGEGMRRVFGNIKLVGEGAGKEGMSPFQALATAIAAQVGTGNIAGCATALASGGPGAIFWMWIVAIFGMMTNYSENVLGIYFRRKNADGEWSGGAMYYLRDGLGGYRFCKTLGAVLAVLFGVFCVLASFGIGNMSQINSIAVNMNNVFRIPNWVTGVLLMILAALVIVGGLKRIASVTEKLVPFMAIAYIIGAFIVVFTNAGNIGPAFASIFKGAFAMKAVGGGIVGSGVKLAVTWGMKRGVFSNEAGLGSSVMVHSSSNVREPVMQGMWGIFEVFADTLVVCTMTALAVLTSGLVDLNTGAMLTSTEKTAMVAEAFGKTFGGFGQAFIAVAILLFAFSTVLGWSHYGAKAFEFLFGTKATMGYKVVFVVFVVVGATMNLDLAWDLSDTFNGLMAIPNLIGVLSLSGLVLKITRNYVARKLKKEDVAPMYSVFPEYQQEAEDAEKTKA